MEVFTDEEIEILKKSLKGHKLECMILLNLGTGLRQGELLALEWDDINFESLEINVNKTIKKVKIFDSDGNAQRVLKKTPKNKTSKRKVPIPSKLVPILKRHKKDLEKQKESVRSSYISKNLVTTSLQKIYSLHIAVF